MQPNRIYERVRVESCTRPAAVLGRRWDEALSAGVHTRVGPAPSPSSPGGSFLPPPGRVRSRGCRLPRTRRCEGAGCLRQASSLTDTSPRLCPASRSWPPPSPTKVGTTPSQSPGTRPGARSEAGSRELVAGFRAASFPSRARARLRGF